MASFLSLPTEVQGIIFTFLNALTPVSITTSSSSYPILVNRTFRKNIISTPRAWTNVQVDLTSAMLAVPAIHDSTDEPQQPYKWLEEVLARSKACLIDVEIIGTCDYATVRHGIVPPLRTALHRIRELVMKPRMDSELLGLMAGLRGSAPNLERIVAQGMFWPGGDEFGGIRPAGASKLRSVTFIGAVAPLRNPLLRNLTHLELIVPMPPFSVRGIMSVLRACPGMQVFKFEGSRHWEEEEDLHEHQSLGPIVLRDLKSLTLYFDGATILLPHLRAPNLTSLHIQRKVSTQDPFQQAALPTFLQAHAPKPPPITELTVDCIGMTTHQWIDCLELLPELRALTSKDKGFDDLLLEYVRLANPLPKLEKWVTSWNFVGHRGVIDFLRARNPPARRPSLPAILPAENLKPKSPRVSAIKHFELVGSRRPHDAAVNNIEFLMLESDPMGNGVLGHKCIMPKREQYY